MVEILTRTIRQEKKIKGQSGNEVKSVSNCRYMREPKDIIRKLELIDTLGKAGGIKSTYKNQLPSYTARANYSKINQKQIYSQYPQKKK